MSAIWEEYRRLYHYTNWDGLLGILKTKTLWATHYGFLNDYSEVSLFRDKLISLLIPAVHEECQKHKRQTPNTDEGVEHARKLGSFVKDFVNILVNAHYAAAGKEIYIASFCGEHANAPYINDNGLLSQWRAYGAGGGFALVLDTRKLWDLVTVEQRGFQSEAVHLSNCVYSDDEDALKREFSEDVRILTESATRVLDCALHRKLNEQDLAILAEGWMPFVRCSTRYKHCGFKEEKEVRLVVTCALPGEESVELVSEDGIRSRARQFRHKNGQCIPYVSLFHSTGIESAIERIIVGPHREKETRAAALRVMLGNRKIDITCSDIPFVG